MMSEKRIFNWGILGPGKIAHKFAQGLLSLDNAKLYSVGSRSAERATSFARQYNIPKIYASYEELAADSETEIIYIASPHSEHYQHVKLCLENGKHVLCEKAFTTNSKQLEELISLSRKKNLFLMEAIWTRFLPSIEKTLEIIQSGTIGEIKMINADFGFQAPYDKEGRLFNPKLAGGALLDIGIYPLFLCLLLLGYPKEIKALAYKGQSGVDESLAAALIYENGAMAAINTTFLAHTSTKAEIFGTKGNIKLNPRWFSPTNLELNINGKQSETIDFNYQNNGYGYEAEEVMHCLTKGLTESALLPLSFSLQLMNLMDEIRKQTEIIYEWD